MSDQKYFPTIDISLEKAFKGYQNGYAKIFQLTLPDNGKSFDCILQTIIEERLSLNEQLLMRKCSNFRQQALKAAKKGHIKNANQFLREAKIIINSGKLSNECYLISSSFQAAVEAYYNYRCSKFNQAQSLINEALQIDAVLVENYGYDILCLHRVQLVNNLMRIALQRMQLKKATELGCMLLSYLEGNEVSLPFPDSWSPKQLISIPSENISAMISQIACEIAIIFAGKRGSLACDLLELIDCNLKIIDELQFPLFFTWVSLKKAFINNKIQSFLDQATQFLSNKIEDLPCLWYATVIDLFILCKELNCSSADNIRSQIARDAVNWRYLPYHFRSLLIIN